MNGAPWRRSRSSTSEIARAHAAGMTIGEIAELLGVGHEAIRVVVRAEGR